MASQAVDELARRAALLHHQGRVASIRDAIHAVGGGPEVSTGLVRRHLAAISESTLGMDAADRQRARVLEPAMELMHAINHHLERFLDRYPDARGVRLAGRAAAGLLDGDLILHLRVLAAIHEAELAAVVVGAGTEEPRFDVVDSRHGRLRRLRTKMDGVEIHLLICPPGSVPGDREVNLVRGEPIVLLDADEVSKQHHRMLEPDRS